MSSTFPAVYAVHARYLTHHTLLLTLRNSNFAEQTTGNSTSAYATFACRCLSANSAGPQQQQQQQQQGGGGRGVGSDKLNGTTTTTTPLQVSPQLNGGASRPSTNGNSNSNEKVRAQSGSSNGENRLVEALEASFSMDCGGKVRIGVQNDLSHPLGILGHRVTVNVIHT